MKRARRLRAGNGTAECVICVSRGAMERKEPPCQRECQKNGRWWMKGLKCHESGGTCGGVYCLRNLCNRQRGDSIDEWRSQKESRGGLEKPVLQTAALPDIPAKGRPDSFLFDLAKHAVCFWCAIRYTQMLALLTVQRLPYYYFHPSVSG